MKYKIRKILTSGRFSKKGIYWADSMDYLDGKIVDSDDIVRAENGWHYGRWILAEEWVTPYATSLADLVNIREMDL